MSVVQALEYAARERILLDVVTHEGCEPDVVPVPVPGQEAAPIDEMWLAYVTVARRADIVALLRPVPAGRRADEPPCPLGEVFVGDERALGAFRRLLMACASQSSERVRRAYEDAGIAFESKNDEARAASIQLDEIDRLSASVLVGRCYAFVAMRSGWTLDDNRRSVRAEKTEPAPQTTENAA